MNQIQIIAGTTLLKNANRIDWAVDDQGFVAGTIYGGFETDLDAGAQLGLIFMYWPGGRRVIAAIKNVQIKALVGDSEDPNTLSFTYLGEWIPRNQLPTVTETYHRYLNNRE